MSITSLLTLSDGRAGLLGLSSPCVGELGLYFSASVVTEPLSSRLSVLSAFCAGSDLSQRPRFCLASSDAASATSEMLGSGGVFREDRLASSVSLLGTIGWGTTGLWSSLSRSSGSGGGCHLIRSSTFFFSFFLSSSSKEFFLSSELDLEELRDDDLELSELTDLLSLRGLGEWTGRAVTLGSSR